jgi:hypothetical protein
MTIWRIRIECWIPEAINTHSEYVTATAFSLKQQLHKRELLLSYIRTYIACLLI